MAMLQTFFLACFWVLFTLVEVRGGTCQPGEEVGDEMKLLGDCHESSR